MKQSEHFKAFITAIILIPIVLILAAIIGGENHEEREARELAKIQQETAELTANRAAYRAFTPEDKLRKKISGITTLTYGETQEGIEALQLTITQRFPSSYTGFLIKVEDYTRAAYASYPQLGLLDIKINLSGHDTYGQPLELPGLLYEMDRQTYQKINWEKFNFDNLPKIATRWTPLHHQLNPE